MGPEKTTWTRLLDAPQQLRWAIRRFVSEVTGRPASLDTPDRRMLEHEIMPWFACRTRYRRVLFVGCDWYTRHYEQVFAGREYWTMEVDPLRRRFGGARHVTDSVANLTKHFGEASLDLIVCNGILG
jgi:hypothetical protein